MDEAEIDFREYATKVLSRTVKETLLAINPSFSFSRLEAPCLAPANTVSNAYDENDIFITNHMHSNQFFVLRPETTYSSYLWAKSLQKKLPLCVWQMAKSFRRETNDGATASKMRFNEFYQLEFQCIYSRTTKADYRASLIENVSKQLQKLCNKEIRIIESDRLPSYSLSTLDIEVKLDNNVWREIASCSIRNDYSEETYVAEIAIGMDRLVTIANS